ncbi:EAL domain-containing protein [Aquibacillus sp. 3ASR75-11]|uniref:EAL domain-containing protein n=1 Tax=Terrihalobacillus insolitus TaxID=2950438 RepID=A0A9X4AMF3_9BACI|nr:EAL domain-containing protein [Terrihalobacillus insolitus]MDC3413463.1 EAL domain-containing protein [Terrihalobacillus insolitus]MDC3425246.1 EAL domain-containing protein [Terrihalobacillus insolitus]
MKKINFEEVPDLQAIQSFFQTLEMSRMDTDSGTLFNKLKLHIDENRKLHQDFLHALSMFTTIVVTDADDIIIYADQNFCALTGFSKTELLGRNHRTLKSDYHDQAFFVHLWDTISTGNVWTGEIKNRKKDGSTHWLKTTIVPLLNEEKQPYAYIAFRTDITDQKREEVERIDTLKNDFNRTVKALVNLVFKVVRNEDNTYYYTLISGKLSQKLGLTIELDTPMRICNFFDETKTAFLKEKYEQAFEGKEVSYKHRYKDYFIYTALSPIIQSGKVVEVIGSSVDITSNEEAEWKIKHMAYHDPLTDLPNRTKLRDDLDNLIQRTVISQPFTIFYCDLDRLKYINDALGQFAGDQVIVTISDRIKSVVADYGSVYRFGGDELIIVIRHTVDTEMLETLANAILKTVQQPIKLVGKEFFITCSIGISRYGNPGITTDELINHAGIAMHYCKVNGRNNKLFYSPKMNQSYNDLILLEGELRKALANNDLALYYQPKVDVKSGQIIGMEALTRWFHNEKGFIPPTRFIPLAEETGIISQLSEWVIREACEQNVSWIKKGFKPLQIAVNISASDLQRVNFARTINQILQETGLPAAYLELEITENSVMQNTEDCIQTMNDLREMGVSLSIDDFGTGYSSFWYLRKFPINHLKIDQSFVRDVTTESGNAKIVKAMIQLAHTFGLKVVAEGVEEPEILQFLTEENCDYYQGYYFSRPTTSDNFEKLLEMTQTIE